MKILSAILIGALLGIAGCGKQETYDDSVDRQNTQTAQNKARVLDAITGPYCGIVHMARSHDDFAVRLTLSRSQENLRSTQSADPSNIVPVIKLAGNVRFPAIECAQGAAASAVPELVEATGDYDPIAITDGLYNEHTQDLSLPFSVPGHPQGNYGELRGKIGEGNRIVGAQWLSDSYEHVGTMDLAPCSGEREACNSESD